MTPNVENIMRLVGLLEEDRGRHLLMRRWAKYLNATNSYASENVSRHEPCQTAYCLCGHINFLILKEQNLLSEDGRLSGIRGDFGYIREISSTERASKWLGVGVMEGERLFYMVFDDNTQRQLSSWQRSAFLEVFDQLPNDVRAACAQMVLRLLARDGKTQWESAIETVLGTAILDQMYAEAIS